VQASPSWTVLGIFTIYLLANVGLFFFLYVIAQKFEPSAAQNGLMFGVLKWLGGVAGAVGAIIGARAGLKLPHITAFGILVLGVLGLMLAPNFEVFMISSWVWEFGFTLGCLYQTAVGISMIFGGKIAGQLLDGGSASGLYGLVAICSLLPSLYILMSRHITQQQDT